MCTGRTSILIVCRLKSHVSLDSFWCMSVQRDCHVVAVKSLLGLSSPYHMVLEEDGSIVTDDVITCVLEDNDHLGSLMVLQPGQTWTPGSTFCCCAIC